MVTTFKGVVLYIIWCDIPACRGLLWLILHWVIAFLWYFSALLHLHYFDQSYYCSLVIHSQANGLNHSMHTFTYHHARSHPLPHGPDVLRLDM